MTRAEELASVRPFEREPERPSSYETPPDDSPRGSFPRRDDRPCRRERCCIRRRQGARPHRLPGRRKGPVHRRLRRAPRRQPASGERPHGREEVAGGGRRGRQGEVLDDVGLGRLHALPLRRERDDVPLHPPEQRRDDEERQPRQVRARNRVHREERRQGRGGPADRIRRRLRRRERRQLRTCTSKSIPAAARP